jgi:hypothetical protein
VRAFALPLVVFAQVGEVLFHLDSEIGESGFAGGGQVFTFAGGVERARRKRESQSKAVRFGAGQNGKNAVKLDEIGVITLQKPGYFLRAALEFFFGGGVSLYVLENDRKFHVCTCRNRAGKSEQSELGYCTALEAEHSKPRRAEQIELRLRVNMYASLLAGVRLAQHSMR